VNEIHHSIAFADVDALQSHERVSRKKFCVVKESISSCGVVREPLLVDASSFTVLDGHHRLGALRALGARRAPVFFVDYSHESVRVRARRKRVRVSKKRVLKRASRGDLFPSKTTKHELAFSVPRIETNLKDLL
jgi:ParB-like chromosome segregation protein Spo0J